MSTISEFLASNSLIKIQNDTKRIKAKYPGRIPMWLEYNKNLESIPNTPRKNKFLVPNDLSIGQLMYMIRRRLKLSCEESLFLYVMKEGKDGRRLTHIPPLYSTISEVYKSDSHLSGFLFMIVAKESTFG